MAWLIRAEAPLQVPSLEKFTRRPQKFLVIVARAWKDTETLLDRFLRRPMTISWKTPGWFVRLLQLGGACTLVGVAGWYSPLVTATIWHVFHPRGVINYRGLQIRVPWPWTADTDLIESEEAAPEGVALKKMPSTMDRRLPPQSLFITVISPDPAVSADEQTKRWMQVFRESHAGATFDAMTPVAVPAGSSCLSANNAREPADVSWSCISLSGGWVVNFEGRERDEPVLFAIVRRLGFGD